MYKKAAPTTQTSSNIEEDKYVDPPNVIWPEWVEQEVTSEKYTTKHSFEDPEGYPLLPRSLRKSIDIWKRVGDMDDREGLTIYNLGGLDDTMHSSVQRKHEPSAELFTASILAKVSVEEPGTSKLIQCNKHLMGSELMRNIIFALHFIYEQRKSFGDDSMPWDLIYPKSKDGISLFNTSGKYTIKLFWLGSYRKVTIDDRVPLDNQNRPLLITSPCNTELWPILVSKALVKLAAQSYKDQDGSELGDFDVLCALRGFIPERIGMETDKLLCPVFSKLFNSSSHGKGLQTVKSTHLIGTPEKGEKKGAHGLGAYCVFAKKIAGEVTAF
jgi:Calpain family cysteine protease